MRSYKVTLAAVALLLVVLLPAWHLSDAAARQPMAEPSSCVGEDPETGLSYQTRVISPNTILDCHTAGVSVTVGANCGVAPLHIVLDIDRSGSMIGQPIEDVKEAARALVQALDMNDPKVEHIQIGLVSHGDPANIDLYLTNRGTTVIGRINRMQAGGEDNLSDSIEKSHHVLRRGRSVREADPFEIAVVLSDGGQTYPPMQAVPAAGRLKAEGVLVIGVCAENGTPQGCAAIRQIASGPRYYFEARGTSGLTRIFREIAEAVTKIHLRTLWVEETLPDGLQLVPDTVVPEPDEIDTSGPTTIKWQFNFPAITETLGYRVRPSAITTYTLAVNDTTFRDSEDKLGNLIVPTAVLTVAGPCYTPTPTVTPTYTPGPTSTNTSTPTPTSTNTPTPTATSTPKPGPIYLPILNLGRCIERDQPIDIVLVIDASTSMEKKTAQGRSKLEAAKAGARTFVELMREVDRAAIIAFNSEPHVLSVLTDDREQLASAIDATQLSPWTRIDLGLRAAAAELASERAGDGHLPVILLMTGGQPTQTTEAEVLRAAAAARSPGTLVFVIGVGPDIDRALLVEVAGDPGRYYHVDDAEGLLEIYERIARIIPCDDP